MNDWKIYSLFIYQVLKLIQRYLAYVTTKSHKIVMLSVVLVLNRWLSARLQYLHYQRTGVTAVVHQAIEMIFFVR